MQLPRFIVLVIILLFALPLRAENPPRETPLVIDSAWTVANNDQLKALAQTDYFGNYKEGNYDLPKEILSDSAVKLPGCQCR
jgi:hypothetical protein